MTQQITNDIISDGSITTAKFDAGAVCPSATNAANATNVTGTGTVGTTQLAANAVTPAKLSQPLTQGTAVVTTSGTSIDFTGIPSWAKRVTIMFSGLSAGANAFLVQLGSGTIQTSSYTSGSTSVSTSTANSTGGNNNSTGLTMNSNNGASVFSGIMTLANFSGNTWVSSHNLNTTVGQIATISGAGVVTLSGALDRFRLTTVGGTDTFDAGSINILYE